MTPKKHKKKKSKSQSQERPIRSFDPFCLLLIFFLVCFTNPVKNQKERKMKKNPFFNFIIVGFCLSVSVCVVMMKNVPVQAPGT